MKSKDLRLSDHHLWEEVQRSIAPLKESKGRKPILAPGRSKPAVHSVTARALPAPARTSHDPPPLAAFDRRMAQQLSRGQLEPDARLDLHGESVALARMKLLRFVETERQNGNRLLLVITGKGASPFARHTLHGVSYFHAHERQGRLRREVPHWLHESQFRAHVMGFQPSHPRHGGGGAFYVRLRRAVAG
jgi:DNA-nicking Smr family endonuclease